MNADTSLLESSFLTTIGLEIHIQLQCQTKLFGPAQSPVRFASSQGQQGLAPNSFLDPTTLGLPGALPSLNALAVEQALRMALALNCEIPEWSQFERKHYFYPDLPKGYQITQLTHPIAKHGFVYLKSGKKIRINRIQLEEDAGKSVLQGSYNLLDFNRSGVALIEIVGEPDLESSWEAAEFFEKIHSLGVYHNITQGKMEWGHCRADANISLRPHVDAPLGTRVEIKNINSFRFLQEALECEKDRQLQCYLNQIPVARETRGYNPQTKSSFFMRSKENEQDYLYFADPDLPKLHVDSLFLEKIKQSMTPEKETLLSQLLEKTSVDPATLLQVIEKPRLREQLLQFIPYSKSHSTNRKFVFFLLQHWSSKWDQFESTQSDSVPQPDPTIWKDLAPVFENALEKIPDFLNGLQRIWENKSIVGELLQEFAINEVNTDALLSYCQSILEKFPDQTKGAREGTRKLIHFLIGQAMKTNDQKLPSKEITSCIHSLIKET